MLKVPAIFGTDKNYPTWETTASSCPLFPALVDDMPAAPPSTDRSTSVVKSALARDQFEILYPTIRGFLLSQFEAQSMPQDAIEYFTSVRRPSSLFPSSKLI
jgi:hypothetical protein